MNILESVHDPKLFAPYFKDRTSWESWFVVLAAIFGLPLDSDQQKVFAHLTGRHTQPDGHSSAPSQQGYSDVWLCIGRRGGKSFIAALIAVFLSCFHDYSKHLARGEHGVVMVIATNRAQARVIMRYITAMISGIPMLARMIEHQDRQSIDLNNSISIEIHTSSFRSVRGYTVVATLLDEVAFFMDETSANPDVEIVNALRPAMSTIPSAKLIALSSPYRQSGILYETYRRYYGTDDPDTLVVQAPTELMNPNVDPKVIARAYDRDPVAAASEYGAQFRNDISGFLQPEWIDTATRNECKDLPPMKDIQYQAFIDPSGGARDAFTLAIAHRDKDSYVVDVVRERWPPFLPESVVAEFSALLKSYRCFSANGDRYAGEWVTSSFKKFGISYRHSTKSKSDLYLEAVPLFAQGLIELPNNLSLTKQLRNLERRTSRNGKDSVDHMIGGHDDAANACCGVLAFLGKPKSEVRIVDLLTGQDMTEYHNDPMMKYFM